MEKMSVKPPARSPRRKMATPRPQLDRTNWIENAIDVLARDGVAGQRIAAIFARRRVDHRIGRRLFIQIVAALLPEGIIIRCITAIAKNFQSGAGRKGAQNTRQNQHVTPLDLR